MPGTAAMAPGNWRKRRSNASVQTDALGRRGHEAARGSLPGRAEAAGRQAGRKASKDAGAGGAGKGKGKEKGSELLGNGLCLTKLKTHRAAEVLYIRLDISKNFISLVKMYLRIQPVNLPPNVNVWPRGGRLHGRVEKTCYKGQAEQGSHPISSIYSNYGTLDNYLAYLSSLFFICEIKTQRLKREQVKRLTYHFKLINIHSLDINSSNILNREKNTTYLIGIFCRLDKIFSTVCGT